MVTKMDDDHVEHEIREAFELNYERLKLEGGHALTEDIKQQALYEVLLYWRRLRDVAEHVTDTEVKLSLPEQKTPKNRTFLIEGVVDIVKEDEEVWMYDIKTHDGEFVKANKHLYEGQLNVYAHIWKHLRGEDLDHTAIIALSFPESLKNAIRSRNDVQQSLEMSKWDPLIEIEHNDVQVMNIISEFGSVVDDIEENIFPPASLQVLKEKQGDTLFATRVCRNCDARFSCSSYREYALGANPRVSLGYKKYIGDLGNDADVEDWKTTNLEVARIPETVEGDE